MERPDQNHQLPFDHFFTGMGLLPRCSGQAVLLPPVRIILPGLTATAKQKLS
jgi:hypothetical protein